MAKFSDIVGFATLVDSGNGIITNQIIEKTYVGDLIRDAKRWQSTSQVNDDLVLSNRISIIADDFALTNIQAVKYVVLNGTKWKVTSIEFVSPRLILTCGGVYNG
jgi:hypothetical protein